jgi:hypothetical protein
MVFSFIFGDNILFRIATHFFIGVTSAYVFILLINSVIIPKLITILFTEDLNQQLLILVPILLSLMLILKLFNKGSLIGNIPLAIMVGSGAAIILTSGFFGTLSPMVNMVTDNFAINSGNRLNIFYGIYLVLGVISTLLYFRQTKSVNSNIFQEKTKLESILNYLGKFFIGTTLGSVFAGVIISSTIALIERINFIINFIYNLIIG